MSVITCPGCMHKLDLPQTCIGQRVKCPKCEIDFEAQPEAKLALDADPPLAVEPPKQAAAPPLDGAYSANSGAVARSAAAPMMFCIECGTKFARSEGGCPACRLSVDAMMNDRPRRRPRWRVLPPLRSSLAIIGAILVPVGFAFFVAALIILDMDRGRPPSALLTFLVAFAFITAAATDLAALVCCLAWLYQAWRLVTREDEDFSAGLKVGLLFVPVFNIYWIFVAIPGLSTAIQNELRYLAPTRSHSTGWVPGLIACILLLMPYFQPIAVCMFIAWMLLANNALQRLIRYHERLREESEAQEDGP